MAEELNFLKNLTGSFAMPAAENPTVEMIEAAYRHHDLPWRYINFEVPPETIKRYAGKYQLAPGAVFTVSVNGNQLLVGLTGQPTFRVFPRSETEWFYKVVDATLTFEVDNLGRCNAHMGGSCRA